MAMMSAMAAAEPINCQIPLACAGRRFDQVMAELLPTYSRARWQRWIKDGHITLDGRIVRPREQVWGGEWITGNTPQTIETEAVAQAIPLAIIHQDDDLIVLNKPPGMVVHPAAGNPDGTLLNALLHHAPELAQLPRAGLVHRLDKDTSGLLVVARTLSAHTVLVEQLQAHSVEREYRAIVTGIVTAGGSIDAPIGRHPVDRKRMAVVANGKPARTHYQVLERFRTYSLLQVKLETGRTHQIRVHMAHEHMSILGDPVYAGRSRIPAGIGETLSMLLSDFRRQALHATRLTLTHPRTDERLSWSVDPPDDMTCLLAALREDVLDATN